VQRLPVAGSLDGSRRLTYTWPLDYGEPPVAGDVLVCVRSRDSRPTGTMYLILAAREVRRREPVPGEVKLAIRAMRVTSLDPETRVYSLVWNPR
jgi:hypothetical protein